MAVPSRPKFILHSPDGATLDAAIATLGLRQQLVVTFVCSYLSNLLQKRSIRFSTVIKTILFQLDAGTWEKAVPARRPGQIMMNESPFIHHHLPWADDDE